jgi:hypothetical protein
VRGVHDIVSLSVARSSASSRLAACCPVKSGHAPPRLNWTATGSRLSSNVQYVYCVRVQLYTYMYCRILYRMGFRAQSFCNQIHIHVHVRVL